MTPQTIVRMRNKLVLMHEIETFPVEMSSKAIFGNNHANVYNMNIGIAKVPRVGVPTLSQPRETRKSSKSQVLPMLVLAHDIVVGGTKKF